MAFLDKVRKSKIFKEKSAPRNELGFLVCWLVGRLVNDLVVYIILHSVTCLVT